MKPSTMQLIVTALDGPHHALAVALLREEFNGAIEPQLPLQTKPASSSTERWRRWKQTQKSVGANASPTPTNALANGAPTPALPLSGSPSLLSHSGNSSEKERECSSLVTREPTSQTRLQTVGANALANANANAVGQRYVAPTDEPTPELIAIAEMVGVQDIQAAWLKFTGHYAGKWVHVAGAWQKWCATEAKHERVERERQRERAASSANPLTAEGLDPSSYEASVARKKRRKAEEEAERAEVRARLEAQKASAQ